MGNKIYIFRYFNQMYCWIYENYVKGKSYYASRKTILYFNNLSLILGYYEDKILEKGANYFKLKANSYGARLFSIDIVNHIVWRDMEYYFGAEFNAKAALHMIETTEIEKYNSSFTGQIGKILNIDAIKSSFPKMKSSLQNKMFNYSSRGAIIYSQTKEFQNVYSYDVVSAYTALLLEQEFPYEFIKTDRIVKNAKCHYGKVTLKGLMFKHLGFYPLYLTRQVMGKNIVNNGKRIRAASEISFYCFLELELPIINYAYRYESIEIEDLYYANTKPLPEESKATIRKYFDQKNEHKDTEDYDSYKLMLNRFFGYFIGTKNGGTSIRDRHIPYQIGIYILSAQRSIMVKLIKKIGIENVVAAHTDGIKTDCDCSDIIKEFNSKRNIYKTMGHWEEKEFFERIEYFSNVQAKYISKGKLGMKHGGISDDDIEEFLADKDYNDISYNTSFYKTMHRYIKTCKYGTYIYKERELFSFKKMSEEGIDDSLSEHVIQEE